MPKSDFKILAIDDEKDILLLLKYNLESEGYIVKTASSGKEGLDIASNYNPDLILIDIMMPNKLIPSLSVSAVIEHKTSLLLLEGSLAFKIGT